MIHSLSKLTSLDDEPITNAFRKNLALCKESDPIQAILEIHVKEVTGIQRYESQSVQSPDQPADEIKYLVQLGFDHYSNKVQTNAILWKPELIEFNETLKDIFPIESNSKEIWTKGMSIQLLQEKYQFVQGTPIPAQAQDTNPKKNDKGVAANKKGKSESNFIDSISIQIHFI